MKNVKCARCVRCGKEYEAVPNLTNCSCGGILDIIYDYDYINAHFTKETLKNRNNPTMWRYRELLPVEETTPGAALVMPLMVLADAMADSMKSLRPELVLMVMLGSYREAAGLLPAMK